MHELENKTLRKILFIELDTIYTAIFRPKTCEEKAAGSLSAMAAVMAERLAISAEYEQVTSLHVISEGNWISVTLSIFSNS